MTAFPYCRPSVLVPSVVLAFLVVPYLLLHKQPWTQDIQEPSYPLSELTNPAYSTLIASSDATNQSFLWSNSPALSSLREGEPSNTLISPNGLYQLTLEPGGGLLLSERSSTYQWRPLFWTSTNDGYNGRSHALQLAKDGLLSVLYKESNEEEWRVNWHSRMLDRCQNASTHVGDTVSLTLDDTSSLQIRANRGWEGNKDRGGDGDATLCDIYTPPDPLVPRGRLGLLVSGLYRNNHAVCQSHISQIVNSWPGSGVDVFINTYHENSLEEKARIEHEISTCYGAHAKGIVVDNLHEVAESVPDAEVPTQCGRKVDRLLSQLKTVFLGAEALYAYMLRTGTEYEYLLRLRTDTMVESPPPWTALRDRASLLIPHPVKANYFYCAHPAGDMGVGTTDQFAYGPKAAMLVWLDMYAHFRQLLREGTDEVAYRGFSGCEALPGGTKREDCTDWAPCSIECLVAYYLGLRGIQYEVVWDWRMHTLR